MVVILGSGSDLGLLAFLCWDYVKGFRWPPLSKKLPATSTTRQHKANSFKILGFCWLSLRVAFPTCWLSINSCVSNRVKLIETD